MSDAAVLPSDPPVPGDARAPEPVVRLSGVAVRYGRNFALRDVTATFAKGAVGLLGPNGAGKSTMIKSLLGFVAPDQGQMTVLGIDVANMPSSVYLAYLFVTLPFVVRMVQPVLEQLEVDVEEAAASLGASRFTTFRRIILPSLTPAIAAGAALSFARGVSEYGSLVLLSGNLPFKTEVTSVRILGSVENNNLAGAAAVATVLLAISLAVIVLLDVLQRRVAVRD